MDQKATGFAGALRRAWTRFARFWIADRETGERLARADRAQRIREGKRP